MSEQLDKSRAKQLVGELSKHTSADLAHVVVHHLQERLQHDHHTQNAKAVRREIESLRERCNELYYND